MRILRGELASAVLLLIIGSAAHAQSRNLTQMCTPDDFRCGDQKCIESYKRCDSINDCTDGADEMNCECRSNEFTCSDGTCIEQRQVCDGVSNCGDKSDELNCDGASCPDGYYTCLRGSAVRCATPCDGRAECSNGEDEDNCEECNHNCDGRCLRDEQICNGHADCTDGSDELHCDDCDGPNDFRCKQSGECLNIAQRCNRVQECMDNSDENNCIDTVTSAPHGCAENMFQCKDDGQCINDDFRCDGNSDCDDQSDEENCPCQLEEWQCDSGACIPAYARCDGIPNCSDRSDEKTCPITRPLYTTTLAYTYRPYASEQSTPSPITLSPTYSQYQPNQYSPSGSIALQIRTYPDAQSIRNVLSGGDVVLQCRDESPQRVPVRWIREGGRLLKPGSFHKNGRLEIYAVTPSDGGTYICQATRYLGQPGSELRVQITVDSSLTTPNQPRDSSGCRPYEATCGNGECILKSAICNGTRECSDGSDEDNCNLNGLCEPNQFQCNNHKCVLKTWLCDSEDDCGDSSDEVNCDLAVARPGECLSVEFKCLTGGQCVPKSFQCDEHSDCLDHSDETNCVPIYIRKPPTPSHLKLNSGDSLTLTCEAVGIPVPLISWRLNWGHVPQNCTSTNEGGIGVLTCQNMQPDHSGAYSCEVINNRKTVFAVPDAIVYVNKTDVCPDGYFNSEARSENECIRCFCFGESTQCRSADLFTYSMPMLLGEGGTRLVGVKQTYTGQIQLDPQPITDTYYYLPMRNGATVTIINNGPSRLYGRESHPYLTLPESYNGIQLTSYGGHIRYRIAPHSQQYSIDDGLPDIIIKGKYETLVHHYRGDKSRGITLEARLTPEHWLKSGPNGFNAASREDIMMALDNIEMILLRADHNNLGVDITDFVMESAQHVNVGLGVASLVEECTCPPGYEGLSCQKCTSGYVREKSGPWLGNCIAERRPCPPGTYGDPTSGYGCLPCPCPLTNPENKFARTCSLGSEGNVICDCESGYGGDTCEYCAPGYVGNPLITGDSCRPAPVSSCNAIGTQRKSLDDCFCKDNVQGRYCDQCKDNSFYLSEDFRQGCALCFCTGVSQQCRSSNLRRKTTSARFNTPQIVQHVRIYSSGPLGPAGNIKYNAPVETKLTPTLLRGQLVLDGVDSPPPAIYYWSLPDSFSGDKVTSYGGYLTYTLTNVPPHGPQGLENNAADVQLISENHLAFVYYGNFVPSSDGTLNVTIQFLERGWQRADGTEIPREQFLLALADVKAILIKATYSSYSEVASLENASIDTAEPNGHGPLALHVEQCVCPVGYIGTSCEDCAPGYTRSSTGIYLEHCGLCECNGHSTSCHPETGVCYNCKDNTEGENCENCKPGYLKNLYNMCEPSYEITTPPIMACRCDPRGVAFPCDASGACQCKQNVEGELCDTCRRGTFGLDRDEPLGCLPCYCSGITSDCHEAVHYSRIEMPSVVFEDNYGGYKITNLNGDFVDSDRFVPDPTTSELLYPFSYRYPASEDLFWSIPHFLGNRVLSYGGLLRLTQKFEGSVENQVSFPGTDVVLIGDTSSVYWTNPKPIKNGEALSYQVPLHEKGWLLLNSATPASRNDFMNVLSNIKRMLVRATLANDILTTSIADVSMDFADSRSQDSNSLAAKAIELCTCPEGYLGSSCESCAPQFFHDQYHHCSPCPCNGHECQLNAYDQVICNCPPPYSGRDCSIVGRPVLSNGTTTKIPPPTSTVVVRITSPTNKIEEMGSSVNFTCQGRSQMTSSRLPVRWTKSGGELPQGRHQMDQWSGLLLITKLQPSDSGTYICHTTDGINTAQTYATLKVPGNPMTAPAISVRPSTSTYYVGDRVELECFATGNPMPEVSWQRAGNYPLPRNAHSLDFRLIIDNVLESDSGEYRCIAKNAAGSNDRVAVITVRPISPSRPQDKLTVHPESPTVIEGQNTRIVCTGTPNIPADSVTWIREDRVEFTDNVHFDRGVLYIEGARPVNQGVYTCQAAYPEVAPVTVLLTVMPQGTPSPDHQPNVTVTPDRLLLSTGDSGSFDCIPLGYPQPRINWKKHEGVFGPGVSQRSNTLIISRAQESDSGYYICEGLLDDGTAVAVSYVSLTIEKRVAPVVEIWPKGEQAVALNSEFEFHCRVLEGVPAPDITWSRSGGRPLSQHAHIQNHNLILKFDTIEVNDEGEYQCMARNDAGERSASAVLKVRSMPELTIRPNNFVTPQYGEPVTVECRAYGYPEPMVSIKSINGDREVVPPAPGVAVLRVPTFTERDEGDYVCSARSAAGSVDDQFVLRLLRGDDVDIGGYDGSGGHEPYPDISYNEQPALLVAYVGKESRLECNGTDGFDVIWRRAGSTELQPNAVQSGSTLIIRDTSKRDAGRYECNVVDRRTKVVQMAASTRLEVVRAMTITLQPKTQTVRPGQSPTVECQVDGDDITDVTWRGINGRPFPARVESRGSTLIFNHIEVEDAGQYECVARSLYSDAAAVAEVIVSGSPVETQTFVTIEQQRRQFRVGENVQVMCQASSRGIDVSWERYNIEQQRQYVENRKYGDGSLLIVSGVQETDAGVYRCTGRDPFGRTSYEDFKLVVVPVGTESLSQPYGDLNTHTANFASSVDLPCVHDLEPPVVIEWRREYTPLPPEVRKDLPNFHLDSVTEADAGIYVCRVSNSRFAVEARAVLRVQGVVPRFDGSGWIALPTIKDAWRQFVIEISFNPSDPNGLIMYNTGTSRDYVALHLVEGVPVFSFDALRGEVPVRGDRPLQLNTWHTIRIARIKSKLTMDVDNTGPFVFDNLNGDVLELNQPLYIGGVPDFSLLPSTVSNTGFVGCVSLLIIGHEEKDIMLTKIDGNNVLSCNSCRPNLCHNNGICQEARNERGYECLCQRGFAGLNCDRTGEACRFGLCGYGKCQDTAEGYKCSCFVNYGGRNCDVKQQIEYPAFTGSAYLAIKPPESRRLFQMSFKIKASSPVTDGIIMYCAESSRGYGAFTSLAVHDGKLEFRFDLGDGSSPVVLTSKKPLPANEWTTVHIARLLDTITLRINSNIVDKQTLHSPTREMHLETPLFVGGVDDSIVLNNNTGVTGGFNGCIKDVTVYNQNVNIVNSSIQSANVQECSNFDRGDIPEIDSPCSQCRNGGSCVGESTTCKCPAGFTGAYCEALAPVPSRRPAYPAYPAQSSGCIARPCRNHGICRPNSTSRAQYTCDCPLGFSGSTCEISIHLTESVGFDGNGYLELPAELLPYDRLDREPVPIALAFRTTSDGVLFYQGETDNAAHDDHLLLRVEEGRVVLDWDLGNGLSTLAINEVHVTDGERHSVVVQLNGNSSVLLIVDEAQTMGTSTGFTNLMNANSNIYIGGIPHKFNHANYPGLIGCIEQVELSSSRSLPLGDRAVASWNAQICKDPGRY